MLSYKQFDNLYCFGYENVEAAKSQYVLDEIKKRQGRLQVKDEAIKNLQYERDLIESDIVSTVSYDLNNSGFNIFRYFKSELFDEAWRYGNHHKDKDFEPYKDKEVKKKEKSSFEFVDYTIKNTILKDLDAKFDNEVLDWNYTTAYEFAYKIGKQKIWVCIPVFSMANAKNYLELLQGYVIRYPEEEHVIGLVTSNLDYKKVNEDLKAWLKKQETK